MAFRLATSIIVREPRALSSDCDFDMKCLIERKLIESFCKILVGKN